MEKDKKENSLDVVIVGGLGHVGLPLGISFADKGLDVCLLDPHKERSHQVRNGIMPFIEYGAEPILNKVIKNQKLIISSDIESVSKAEYVIVTVGTEIDEYQNPRTTHLFRLFENLYPHLKKTQTIIIRSTVCPNACSQVRDLLNSLSSKKTPAIEDIVSGESEMERFSKNPLLDKQTLKQKENDKRDQNSWLLSYCPERIVQGYAIKELNQLPQIVSGFTKEAQDSAAKLFEKISPKIVRTTIMEAELIKLFSNALRYIEFATTNQFYIISKELGVDYDRIREAMVEGYPRIPKLPSAGFAAGPCLLKDTLQLAVFNKNNFPLGVAAMNINEGLPDYIVSDLKKKYDLKGKKVGILGMAFKADIDDIRDSLSYKLRKVLQFNGAQVYCSDEYVKSPEFITKERLLDLSDILIVGVPHSAYKGLEIPTGKYVVDLWDSINKDK